MKRYSYNANLGVQLWQRFTDQDHAQCKKKDNVPGCLSEPRSVYSQIVHTGIVSSEGNYKHFCYYSLLYSFIW